uniref:Uncharacterized protein n=1 Tax=Anguilla anguilla TaxID=7936 RepID=A0A0E9WTB5_ANGAN
MNEVHLNTHPSSPSHRSPRLTKDHRSGDPAHQKKHFVMIYSREDGQHTEAWRPTRGPPFCAHLKGY